MTNHNMNKYQQNQISTASPEQILLMLYDGAIRFVRKAICGIENDDSSLRMYGVSKTMAIVTEFSNSLNREIGGKIAEDLDALYDFMIRELTAANLEKNIEKLQVVEKLLVDLRQTWGEAVEINKKENGAQKPSASSENVSAPHQPDKYQPLSISR